MPPKPEPKTVGCLMTQLVLSFGKNNASGFMKVPPVEEPKESSDVSDALEPSTPKQPNIMALT